MKKQKEKGIKKLKKREKGITLIALVITVIVLLILAAVSIATLTGQNGILTRANDAKEQTEIGKEKEIIGLAYNGVMAENKGKEVTIKQLEEELNLNGQNVAVIDNGDDTTTVTFESWNEYKIDNQGNITGPIPTNIFAAIKITGEKVTTPPLPNEQEFVHTEGSLDTGYVIQDKDGNEFVWVPVDKNQKLEINVKTKEENIKSITLTDPYGNDILTENDKNKNYSNTQIEPTINGPYILEVNTEKERKVIVLSVHSLYAVDSYLDLQWTNEFVHWQGFDSWDELLGLYTEEFGYEVTRGDFYKILIEAGEVIRIEQYVETKNNADSINNAGGFYISRYEASYENGNVAVKKSKSANLNTSIENGKLWNEITYENAKQVTEKMYEDIENKNFESSLLTAASWDRVLGWLYETGEKSAYDIVSACEEWGNYKINSVINTGSNEDYKANNIYDFNGNLFEWTTEKNSYDNNQIFRGGVYSAGSIMGGVATRSTEYEYHKKRIGFRPAIYLNT